MMVLTALTEPIICPVCNAAGRTGFLFVVRNTGEGNLVVKTIPVIYECNTCGVLYGEVDE